MQLNLLELPFGFVGITGTRDGLSQRQRDGVEFLLSNLYIFGGLRHGDAIGVDCQVADIAASLGIWTVAHPPDIDKYRGFHQSTLIMPEKPYRERDMDIVIGSDLLIACPKQSKEIVRSGTWATVRDARKKKVPRIILLP